MARIIMCGSLKGGVGKSDNLLRSRRSCGCAGDDWTSDDESVVR